VTADMQSQRILKLIENLVRPLRPGVGRIVRVTSPYMRREDRGDHLLWRNARARLHGDPQRLKSANGA